MIINKTEKLTHAHTHTSHDRIRANVKELRNIQNEPRNENPNRPNDPKHKTHDALYTLKFMSNISPNVGIG